jgi:hypothetical protein
VSNERPLVDIMQSIFKCEGVGKIFLDNKLHCTLRHILTKDGPVDVCLMGVAMPKRAMKHDERKYLSELFNLSDQNCRDIISSIFIELEESLWEESRKLSIVKKEQPND